MTEAHDTTGKPQAKRFGIDHTTGRLVLGSVSIPLPQSRFARLTIGVVLIFGGVLGFLPVLGFCMIPLGFIVLSRDLHPVRRMRRRFSVWWSKRRKPAP